MLFWRISDARKKTTNDTFADTRRSTLDADNGIEKDISSEQLSPYEILEQQRIIALLYQGLATLSEKQQQRIHAHYFLGMSLSQIAKNEGRSVPTIKESIERGIKRLEKYFEEKGEPAP